MMPGVLGYVLAGGESSRMQRADLPRDKAVLEVGGETLLQRALTAVATVCPEPRILCGPPERCDRLRHFGPTVPDRLVRSGPLGGLQAALYDAVEQGGARVLLVPVDLPWMTPALLRRLALGAVNSGSAAACMHDGECVQPLPCVIHTSAAPMVDTALQAGERRLLPLLRSVGDTCGNRAGLLILRPAAPGSDGEVSSRSFWNINTPEDFEAVQNSGTLGSSAHQSKHGG